RASSSCRITLTNYSTSTLMNPTYYVPTESERKIRLPSLIDGDKSEAICFEGSGEFCRFLCSFEIGTTLLPNFSVNKSLYSVLGQNDLPADWVMSTSRETPIEVFSNQGNYFARVIEVANYLIVPIKLRGCRSCESSRTLAEVPPLGMEIFFATGKWSIEAAIVYEIESTDLALVVAVKAGRNENKFAAVFIPVARITLDDNLDKLLDQNQWNYLLRHKFASAKDGEQMIQTRNIKVNISMTMAEGQKSDIKIRMYTV
ncbi:unnamed protein product, partial [Allacma fusca]